MPLLSLSRQVALERQIDVVANKSRTSHDRLKVAEIDLCGIPDIRVRATTRFLWKDQQGIRLRTATVFATWATGRDPAVPASARRAPLQR